MKKKEILQKIASIGDFGRKTFGYHDLNEISQMAGIPKADAERYYHGLKVPNQFLIPKEEVAKDLRSVYDNSHAYGDYRQKTGLLNTEPGSEEEKKILKRHKPKLDLLWKNMSDNENSLREKYHKLKNP